MSARYPTIRALLCTVLMLLSGASGFQSASARFRSPSSLTQSIESAWVVESVATNTKIDLPPVLQGIVDERQEYHVKLGRAMDTLRKDMQTILTDKPDFSIYHKDITLLDPSGVQLHGINQYKSAFAFFKTFVNFWFSPSIQFRMVYDQCRSSIRVSWHAVLIPKILLGRPLHVDGISYYQLDSESGLIVEHKIENLVINNTPIQPPYGIFSLLQQDAFQMQPVGAGAMITNQ
ncbi:hypothetical protein MPSEU_000258000 [Mayamaea pseudoterrestris]|nr:hypothetical protein MPSEU_000258000 [Mayamaea pseudoterrestris]